MNKQKSGWVKKKLWPLQSWHFVVVALIFASLGVLGLRNNNLRMVELRQEVFIADESNGEVGKELDELREYVFSHMNSSTTVELKYTYQRAAERAIKNNNNVTSNANIFEGLPAECGGGLTFADSTDPCVRDFINRRIEQLGGENPTPTTLPNKQLFIYRYESPLLSFDFAGISLLISMVSTVAAGGIVLKNFMRNELSYYKGDVDGL